MKMMKRVFSLLLFFVAAMSVQTVQAQTNGDVNGDGKVNEQDIAAILEIMAEAGGVKEQTKYYWYVGNGGLTDPNHPMNNGIATNIDKINLTFELDKSNNLLQTATSYTDLVGKEFPFPNHFIIPTEWLDKIQIVNANNFPWAWDTTVIDSTNKYTWCWNSGTGTGTLKIVAK